MRIIEYFKERFKKFKKDDYILLSFLFVFLIIILYFTISMTISIANGYTLFGYQNGEAETVPSYFDTICLSLFWVLSSLLLITFFYNLIFKKIKDKKVVKKEIVDGKTIYIDDEK